MLDLIEKIEKLAKIVDRQEQYSCCDSLLPHGITEGEREKIDDLDLINFK